MLNQKELDKRYRFLMIPMLMIIFALLQVSIAPDYPEVLTFAKFDASLIIATIIATWIAYKHRFYAMSFLILESVRANAFGLIWLTVLLTDFKHNFVFSISSIGTILAVYILTLRYEIKIWERKLASCVSSKKIDLKKDKFYILRLAIDAPEKQEKKETIIPYILIIMIPLALVRIIGPVDKSNILFIVQPVALVMMLCIGYAGAVTIAFALNISRLQKERNIVLKTEYADLRGDSRRGYKRSV